MKMSVTLAVACLTAGLAIGGESAAENIKKFDLNISRQTLDKALKDLARQTGLQIARMSDRIDGSALVGPLTGELTTEEALGVLLKGQGLVFTVINEKTIAVMKEGADAASVLKSDAETTALTANTLSGSTVRLAQASHNSAQSGDQVFESKTGADNAHEEVIVRGTYTIDSMNGATGLNMSLRETPQSVTIITKQMIEDKGLGSIASVLQHVPGVSMIGNGSEKNSIYVRGSPLDSGIQIDGAVTTSANPGDSGAIGQGIDPVVAERVEVLKGAAGILGGLGEPSATVNMIRKRPTETFRSSVAASAGRWNVYRGEADVSGPLSASGRVRGRLVGAYQQGESFRDRYESERSVVYGIAEADLTGSTVVGLAIDYQGSDVDGAYMWASNPAFYTDGTPIDLDRSYSTGQKWSYENHSEWSVMPDLQHTFENGWVIKASSRYAKGKLNDFLPFPGPWVDKTTGNFVHPSFSSAQRLDLDLETRSFNLYTTGGWELFGRKHDFVLGYSYNSSDSIAGIDQYAMPVVNLTDRSIAPPDPSAPIPSYGLRGFERDWTQSQSGIYTTARFSLAAALKLMVGGRMSSYEYLQKSNRPQSLDLSDDQSGVFTPYFGVVYDLNEFASIYASYTGIFYPVRLFGADGEMLDPTEGTNREAGIKMAFFDDKLNIAAAIYRANKDNVPEYANQGQLPNGEYIHRSIDGIKTDGYEFEIAGSLTPRWDVSGGYTHNTSNGFTLLPEDILKFTTVFKMSGVMQGLTIGGSVRWQSATYFEDFVWAVDPAVPFTHEQKAYALVDLVARYDFSDDVSLSLNVNNLLDESYSRSAWGYTDFGEPRHAILSLRWKR